ncbi:MAG TPA: HIT family protein [Dehalococcoidia bacterium]|nr:HIT family protein [Dehalococcoidia bacterium]
MPIDVPQRDRCAFCNNIASLNQFVVVEELEQSLAFLPARQHGTGHVLVIPRRHAPTLIDLDSAEAAAIMQQVHRVARAIAKAYDPAGLNVFQNNGVTAGQTVPHYHVHIVPSYAGDPAGRIFRAEEFERRPHEELLTIAEKVRAQLEPAGLAERR